MQTKTYRNAIIYSKIMLLRAKLRMGSWRTYVTKIEYMMGFWRAMNRPERQFLLNAPLATCRKNNLVTPELLKTREGLLSLRTRPAQWYCRTYSADQKMFNNLIILMLLLNMRLTAIV
jgi:hypothetical protein